MRDASQPRKNRGDPRAATIGPMTAAPTAGDALALVRLAASGAAGALARHASRIDDINVFPVPDGDTGANLSQTARSVLDALAGELAARALARSRASGARAALLGARGNSGIILSQLVRGACDRLGEGGPLDGRAIADALRRASTEADAALREPVEGTILTVARALADGAEAARSDDPIATLAAGLAAAEAALARTPDMLPVAARGGRRRRRRRRARRARARRARRAARRAGRRRGAALGARARARSRPTTRARATAPASSSRARSRASSSSASSRRSATASSSSATASSCARTCTPTIPAARSRRRRRSARSRASRSATCTRSATRSPSALAAAAPLEDDGRLADILAIVDGDGNRVLYASLGARLLLGGRPTVDELLDAIRASPAAGIVVLPERPGAAAWSPSTRRRRPRSPCTSCPRAGSRRGSRRSSPTAPTSPPPCSRRRSRRRPRGPAAPRCRGGDGDDAAALREAVAPRARAGLDARHGARRRGRRAARRSTRSRPGSPTAHPGVELELHAGGQAHPRYSVSAE